MASKWAPTPVEAVPLPYTAPPWPWTRSRCTSFQSWPPALAATRPCLVVCTSPSASTASGKEAPKLNSIEASTPTAAAPTRPSDDPVVLPQHSQACDVTVCGAASKQRAQTSTTTCPSGGCLRERRTVPTASRASPLLSITETLRLAASTSFAPGDRGRAARA